MNITINVPDKLITTLRTDDEFKKLSTEAMVFAIFLENCDDVIDPSEHGELEGFIKENYPDLHSLATGLGA